MVDYAKFRPDEPMDIPRVTASAPPPVAGAGTPEANEHNLLYRAGQWLRSTVVPAIGTAYGAIADTATLVPRSLYSAAGNVAAGVAGAQEPKDFTAFPLTQRAAQNFGAPTSAAAPTVGQGLRPTGAPTPSTNPPAPASTGFSYGAPARDDYVTRLAGGGLRPTAAQPAAQTATVPQAGGGMRFALPQAQDAYERLGLKELLRSPGPSTTKVLRQNDKGEYYIQESINGGDQPPTLRKPMDPTLFTGTQAQLEEANKSINEYNTQLMAGYGARNNLWEASQGVIPREQAQAGKYTAEAEAEPGLASSLRGLRAQQTLESAARTRAAGYGKVATEVPYGDPRAGRIARQESFVPYPGSPGAGIRQPAPATDVMAALNALPEQQRSIVDKYFEDKYPEGGASPEEVMNYISTLAQ